MNHELSAEVQCGQRVAPVRPTLHELLHDALHELTHIDGKILRTLGLLLFKPGELTKEFLAGKRVRSVTPVRIYLLCSVLFFGIMSLLPSTLKVSVDHRADAQLAHAAARANQDPAILGHAMKSAFPKAMFVLMPLFALVVFAFFFRDPDRAFSSSLRQRDRAITTTTKRLRTLGDQLS